jgi:nicotinamide-nucleotide adenylyltransferase
MRGWMDSVPNTVYTFLTKINAKNRLKVISKSYTKPTEH